MRNHFVQRNTVGKRSCQQLSLPIVFSLIAAVSPSRAYGESYFNPAFLSDDVAAVADLSRFEKGNMQPAGNYHVDIYLNGNFISSQDVPFEVSDDKSQAASSGLVPCLDADWLKRLGVNLAAFPELQKYQSGECAPVTTLIEGTELKFDFSKLKLNINFPQAAMLSSARGYIPPEEWDDGIPAIMSSYYFSGSQNTNTDSYYLSLQNGLNAGAWRLRNNSSWSYTSSDGYHTNNWKNISTYVQRGIEPLKGEIILGDSNTGNDVFESLGFRGLRLHSVDGMHPDSQQGYAPTVRGIAQGHAKVTIRQNGYVIYQSYVTPGAFAINDLNPTSSSGDLNVLVEEQDGSQQSYTVPYSTVPLLQREGRMKYDLIVGDFRSGRREQSNPTFVQGSLIYGLSGGNTIYSGVQAASDYNSVALGLGKNLGTWGAVSFDITHAQSQLADDSKHKGQSLRFLYAKSLNTYGTNLRLLGYRYSTKGFYTLDEVAYKTMEGYEYEQAEDGSYSKVPVVQSYYNLRNSKKGRLQANITQSLGDYGSFYTSASQQTYWGTSGSNTWYQLGYANNWQGVNYSLSWSWNKSLGIADSNKVIAMNVSVPLNILAGKSRSRDSLLSRSYAGLGANRDSSGHNAWQTNLGGTLLEGQNLSYNVSYGHSNQNSDSGSANLNWQGTYGTLGAGYNYSRDNHEYNWRLSGGIVGHADGITLGQPLGNTNVLIKAPGASGVRIENQTGVKTDWRGYAVVPYATVYRYNRIALDANSMGHNTEIENNVSNIVPTEGALVRASFKAHIGVRAMVALKIAGRAVPFGSSVQETTTGQKGMADDEGQVYLAGLPLSGTLHVQWGESPEAQCTADYSLPKESLDKPIVFTSVSCN